MNPLLLYFFEMLCLPYDILMQLISVESFMTLAV